MADFAKLDNEFSPRKPKKPVFGPLIGGIVCLVFGSLSLAMVLPSVNFDGASHLDVPGTIIGAIIAAIFFWQAYRLLRRAIRG